MRTHHDISIPAAGLTLRGDFHLPERARGVVLFVHGSGTTRRDPQNELVASRLERAGFGTLLVDLLDDYETRDRHNVFDVEMQAQRLLGVVRWLRSQPQCARVPLGYFATGVGTGVALIAAAREPQAVSAIVSRGGRPDTAGDCVRRVRAPTLFIAAERGSVPDWVDGAFCECDAPKELVVVESRSQLFREPRAREAVARHAERWFARHLPDAEAAKPERPTMHAR